MGEFVKVEISLSKCLGNGECGRCISVCPVNIFGTNDNYPAILQENEDECTLCDLCIETCTPGAIAIRKVYEK